MTEKSEELARLAERALENPRDSEVESFRVPNLAPDALECLINGLQEVLTTVANADFALVMLKLLPLSNFCLNLQAKGNSIKFIIYKLLLSEVLI